MSKTTPRKTHVPAIPEVAQTAESVHRVLMAAKEAIEVGYGRRGDPIDRFATLRDLRDGGIADLHRGPNGEFSVSRFGTPGTGAPIRDDGNSEPDYGDEDYTKPRTPTGVVAKGMPPDIDAAHETAGLVMVTWDAPRYHNHHYAEIYRMDQFGPPLATNPDDPLGPLVPVFDIATEMVDPNRPFGASLSGGAINQMKPGSHVTFAGVATGTIFIDRDLPPLEPAPQGGTPPSDLDRALNPGSYHYWVRFVSRARVVSYLSDRAGTSLSINPVLVLDAMTRNVTSTAIYANLREWLGLGSPEAGNYASLLEYMDTVIDESGIKTLWSVRMQHETVTGLTFAAGFGLGMETDTTGKSLSTFLVNANQFAIMGPNAGKPGSRVLGVSRQAGQSDRLRVLLQAMVHQHKLDVGDTITLSATKGNVRVDVDADTSVVYPPDNQSNPFDALAGMEFEVLARNDTWIAGIGDASELVLQAPHTLAVVDLWADYVNGGALYSVAAVRAINAVVMPSANIPFIVDTASGVVGIRGKLIVDGLVRATQGEFDELTANTAFIKKLQAEVVNANVVIGQRIIAGTPDIGAITGAQYQQISNYIVELNNPAVSSYPFRIWKPSDGPAGHSIFDVNNQGDLYVGGHLTVNKAAVIRGQPGLANGVIFSTGGGGADTGPNTNYALWIGPESNYGNAGMGRDEGNGIFWVKSDGRAGFRADLFLGDDPLALPSGNGTITVKPKINGGAARVFCSAGFSIIGQDESANCQIGAALFLIPKNTPGLPTAWPITRSPIGFESPTGNVSDFAGFFGTAFPSIPGGALVATTQVDSRGGSRDVKSGSLQASVVVPAGDYTVYLAFWKKGSIGGESPHGCFAISPFAVQVSNDATANRPAGNPGLVGPMGNAVHSLPAQWIVASEDILKGCFVNIHEVGGQPAIRHADADTDRKADGWIMVSALAGDRVEVYRDGINPYCAGLVVGDEYVLSDVELGGVLSRTSGTPPTFEQYLGKALSETELLVEIDAAIQGG